MKKTVTWAVRLMSIVALASAIGLPASTFPVNAQILDQAYVNVPFEKQKTIVWCWAAAARMVARYYNAEAPSQCEMLEQRYGAPCCVNPYNVCTVPGSIWQIQDLIQSFGLTASTIGPPANGYVLLNLFKQGRPIVIHLVQGHFVVAAGIKVVESPMGPLGIVRILDPFYGIREMPLPELYMQWDAAVYVH